MITFCLSYLLIGIFFCEMFTSEDIGLAGGGDEYVTPVTAILDGGHLIFHGSLQLPMMITLQPKPLRD